ncbi:Fatty acyl-CoA elongase/Polyunsaturated fatty acid specific elongation enzyme [Entomophthora muscae]|uniref:Fatty acyl-CoA elongase/Polyunsaturated fatty acid specific elongation enzyme n=1 Tax=Entomophthora muscae TaxID=34485 RepID=A0ACC2TW71_9FUNG|nr:Fatty acyl-CoA elongase/Polyunsaturated fatty acid specific elongation enzyme [Entomophthora muscae]
MYYYYFLATFGIKVWWKKSITILQITQFVIDLVVIYFCLYTNLAFASGKLPVMGDCSGDIFAAFFGAGLLSSYLLLFIEFFYKVYTKPTGKPASQAAEKLKSL